MEYIFLLIICAAGFVLLYLILRRIVHRWFVNSTQLERIQQEVERMLVELNHATGRNVDLIESRIKDLRELLATVDKRIGLLKRESEKHEIGKTVYNRIARTHPPGLVQKPEEEEISSPPIRDRILNLYHSGFSPLMIATQVGKSIGEVELVISLAEKG